MKQVKMLLLLAASMMVPQIQAATIHLTQGGWDTGGPLNISFTGDDTNSNGGIDTEELTNFAASFVLPGGGTFTWSLADLGSDGFFFSPGDYFIKADSPTASLYDTWFAGSGVAIVSDFSGSFIALSGDELRGTGSAVPEPGTGAFLGLGIFGAAAYAGMRRSAASANNR